MSSLDLCISHQHRSLIDDSFEAMGRYMYTKQEASSVFSAFLFVFDQFWYLYDSWYPGKFTVQIITLQNFPVHIYFGKTPVSCAVGNICDHIQNLVEKFPAVQGKCSR